jgi:hypothetical protein
MPIPRKYASNAERQSAYRARRSSETTIIGTAPPTPGYRRWGIMIRQARTLFETITNEMAAYYEERSESWKDSERGENFTERLESIEEMVNLILELP